MKEFIEKLIERLEEYIEEYSETDKNGLHSERWCAMQEAKMVVNQLAEEYKHCCLCYSGIPCEYQNKNAILPNALLADKNGWIPCSERLPESKVDVLVWKDNMYSVAWYQKVTKHWLSNDFPANESKNVIAWQPLPEPYKPTGQKVIPAQHFKDRFNKVT